MKNMEKFFTKAKPVWAADKAGERNVTCLFSLTLGKGDYILRVTACNFYSFAMNGAFYGYGPARAAHGYARVDEYRFSLKEQTELLFTVAGYACNSFYSLNEPPFFQAEVLSGGNVVAYTDGEGGFSCAVSGERLQKVARFSYQRPFSESYDFTGRAENIPARLSVVPQPKLLPRGVSYPVYDAVCSEIVERGIFEYGGEKTPYDARYLRNESLGLFPLEELQTNPARYLEGISYRLCQKKGALGQGDYAVYAFPCSETGFLRISARIGQECHFLLIFDEVDYRTDRKADEPRNIRFERNDTYNIVEYRVKAGAFEHTAFEPYTARYVKILVLSGSLTVGELGMLRYENPDVSAPNPSGDDRIDLILDAAARTFRHNAVDLLTDCPSRERAGWLCDSWFSARAERFFTGENKVERNFLENIALSPKKQAYLPEGMIPMCYPADFSEDKMYIPNWAMWYVIELEDYQKRTGDGALSALSKEKVYSLLRYFEKFENADGLLENLEGWIFLEWSKANDEEFVCGVNYPSNMIYAAALKSAAALYGDGALALKAEAIAKTIRAQAYNGEFFEDNAVRKEGELVRTGNTSETCQYYAFFSGVATPETYKELWERLLCSFGPNRLKSVYPKVYPSNAFIGNYLRLCLLKENGYCDRVKEESVDYFYKMARETGTLWEHDSIFGSLDHGFASYIAVLLAP